MSAPAVNVAIPEPAPKRVVTRITPEGGDVALDGGEMYRYRELLYFLIWRDFKVRYKQTVLGVAWAVVQPVFNMVVFTVIFGRLAKIDSEGFPYPLFVFAGLLPWTLFASGVNQASASLVNQQHLMTKVYFPRLFVPTASVGITLVDFAIACLVCVGLLAFYQTPPPGR